MPGRKKKEEVVSESWPKVIQGSHSTRIEYEDGRVEFTTDWEALKRDVQAALLKYESNLPYNSADVLTEPKKSATVIKNKPLRVKKTKK